MLKRNGSRAPSPTGTSYSGISNYRTDSYRPLKNPPAVPQMDPKTVAKAHFDELSRYLAEYLAAEPANSRASARQKLTRLTRQQFQELSTDVYDELLRRKNNEDKNEVPFLPVRDDFHPKRNQARQKLATLPTQRFMDLSSDVYYELARRYPEFKEQLNPNDTTLRATSPGSTYDDMPSPDFPATDPSPRSKAASIVSSSSRRRPSQDVRSIRSRPSIDQAPGRRSEEGYEGVGRRPSTSTQQSDSTANPTSAQATSGMIIPNKSTIAEEEIEVPYGSARASAARDRDSISRSRSRSVSRERGDATDGELGSPAMGGGLGLGGLSGLRDRLRFDGEDDGKSANGQQDYYDRMSLGRASVASDRSGAGGGKTLEERLRREYEYKIATMQSRIVGLEREGGGGGDRVRMLEEELEAFRKRAEEQSVTNRALQKELEELKEDRARDKEVASRRAREDEEELQILRERCEALESERGGGGADPDMVEQLRSDMEGLMVELSDLSTRNDELMNAKDSDLAVIRDLDAQVKEYKRKYEHAKTELRSVKATSQLFSPAPKNDDQLPTSSVGGLLDIHVTAFVSAIDSLLKEGRGHSPTRVLMPMKSVVNAVTAIVDDVRAFERRAGQDQMEVDLEALKALRERAEATLSNLVAATKTHATSAGMAPVSLLDAAASHVSLTVTEIGKTVCIRKATKAEQDQFAASYNNSGSNGFSPALRAIDEGKHSRVGSNSSTRGVFSPPSSRLMMGDRSRRAPSEPSSSHTSSPPPIFDGPLSTGRSDDSAGADGSEDAWAELKPYLEAQTESIVYAIQSVLSGVRSPTPSPNLNENITQIITIVSSIVAVCKDNLPPSSAQQGNEVIHELSEHANKLSEVQALAEVTKESRQTMAKSSFAIANAMKALMKIS